MKLRFTPIILVIVLIITSLTALADGGEKQKKDRYKKSLRFFYQAGSVLQTNEFVKGRNESGKVIDYFQSASFQYGVETDGRKIWQQIYGYPTWGFGIYGVNFFDKDELGTPTAVYGFFDAPLKRFKRWAINYEVGFGLTYDWKPYDQNLNPYQYAIGSYKTVFIDAGLNLEFMLGKHWNLTGGFTFTHFSNGATKVPNYGINLMAPRVGLKYIFNERPEFIKTEIPKYERKWEYYATLSMSSKQLAYDTTQVETNPGHHAETYGIITLSTGINRQISRKIKFGAGIDIGWDGAWNSYINYVQGEIIRMDAGNGNKVNMGVYGAFELVVHNLSVIAQPGWYLFRDDWKVPEKTEGSVAIPPQRKSTNSYQRLGIKYHVSPGLFFGINIRAYDFGIADYIEWNVGYRVMWKK